MNGPLVQYDALCRMIAEAKTFNEVRDIRDEMEHVKLYGRKVKDRELIAEATELHARASRRLGQLLDEAERLGWIGQGRPRKNLPTTEGFRLKEAGIDYKTSSESRQLSALDDSDFETGIKTVRNKIVAGGATVINGARAIMSSRHEPGDGLDFFPTPPIATRALFEHALPHLQRRGHCKWQKVWEPACGEGHMAEVLGEYFPHVFASDIHNYGYSPHRLDFLSTKQQIATDWIITNPPFGDKAEQFTLRALQIAGTGVAIFARLQWLEGEGRCDRLFKKHPPTLIAFFAERIPIWKGRWNPEGGTATAYIWLVWIKGAAPQAPFWIPPGCCKALTHPDDVERFTQHPVTKRVVQVKEPAA